MNTWMIYGANGYTGERAAREAKQRGMTPILAGRNAEKIASLGKELKLETRAFDLNDAAAADAALKGVDTVLHCAGPFSATNRPMLDACLRGQANYLDITGEIAVFEAVHARDEEIKKAGVAAIPGVGFDVVPSDCLAALLKDRLPDATHLALAIRTNGKPSPGTLKTMVEGLDKGGCVRRDGRLTRVPTAYKTRKIRFDGKDATCVTIPWGDVSTAYYSTDIPNIEVYVANPSSVILSMKALNLLRPVFALPPVQSFLKSLITRFVPGPTAEEQERSQVLLWGEAINAKGKTVTLGLIVPEGYRHTVDAALSSVKLLRERKTLKGFLTPSRAFGKDFVLGLKDVRTWEP